MDAPENPPLAPARRLKAVILDLDDTLVVSTVDFPKFKRLVIGRMGEFGEDTSLYDPSETIVAILDRFERRMRSKGVSEEQVRDMLASLDRIMDAVELERVDETVSVPGAAEMVAELRRKGVRVGVLTRGCEEYARRAMARAGIDGLVDAAECRNSRTRPKPYPDAYLRLVSALGVDLGDTIFVGDHPIDASCAMNAGVPFVGVRTGDVPDDVLLKAGAYTVIGSVAGLVECLGGFLPD